MGRLLALLILTTLLWGGVGPVARATPTPPPEETPHQIFIPGVGAPQQASPQRGLSLPPWLERYGPPVLLVLAVIALVLLRRSRREA